MINLPQVQFCRLPNGHRLAWREWGAGDPLIMLHGWSMTSSVFSEVAPVLAAGYRVLCPDLPGHGESDSTTEYQLTSFATAIEQWTEQLGILNTALLGWSLGGQVALQLAADQCLSVSKLVLVATTPLFCQAGDWSHGLPAAQVKSLDRNLGRAYEKTMADFFNLQFVDEDLPKERYRQVLAFAVRSGRLPDPEQARNALEILSNTDLRPSLHSIELPTLVMHGELDQIIPPAAGEYLARHLPNAQMCLMPAVGHAPFFSCPEESVRRWLSFLQ